MSDGDLVKRLMGYADRVSSGVNETCAEAADRIAALTAERDALALQVQRARDDALEEAAFAAESFTERRHIAHDIKCGDFPKRSDLRDAVAAAIRALRGATEGAGG
jgi:hypothetical protein